MSVLSRVVYHFSLEVLFLKIAPPTFIYKLLALIPDFFSLFNAEPSISAEQQTIIYFHETSVGIQGNKMFGLATLEKRNAANLN
jgi:hypothetical protein